MNNRRGMLFILVGLVAALAAGVVVFFLALNLGRAANEAAQQQAAANIVPTPSSQKEVIVAKNDIEANTIITTSMLLTATYPADLLPADAYTNTVELLGKVSTQRIPSGLPLLKREFVESKGRVGSSVIVPKGKVLTAFPSTDILNSTGAIQPGDHVDILLTLPISGTTRLDYGSGTASQVEANSKSIVSQATLQNIEVYSTGLWTPPSNEPAQPGRDLKIVTFIVDHQEALILKYVKDSGGTIDLVVRALQDNEEFATDPVNLDYLVDLYKFIGLPKQTP